MSKTLLHRITAAMWLLTALSCLLAVSINTILIVRNAEIIARERIIATETTLVSLGLLELLSKNEAVDLDPRIPETLESARLSEIVRIYEPPGELLYTNLDLEDLPTSGLHTARWVDGDYYIITGASREYLSRSRSYSASNGKVFWLEVTTPRPVTTQIVRANAWPFVAIFAALLMFSLLIARLVAFRSLSPIRQVVERLDQIDPEEIKRWKTLPIEEIPKDFQPITVKVNELILRTQRAFLNLHHLGRYIAHEVRTPLTIIRGEIETALMKPQSTDYEPVLRSALDEVSKLEEIVGGVLKIATRERASSNPYKPESVDMAKLFEELEPGIQRIARRAVRFEISSPLLPALLDRELFELLVSNLIRNIATHTPETASATVRAALHENRQVLVEVSNDGSHFPPEIIEEANDPESLGAHLGLGLRLCREICAISKLRLEFENVEPSGVRVRIYCPLA